MPFLNAALQVRNAPAPPAFKARRKSPEEPPRRVAFSNHPGQQQEQGREHSAEPIGESVRLFCNRPGLRARLQANCLSQAGDGQRKAIKDSPTPLKNKCEHAKTQYQKNRKNGPTQTGNGNKFASEMKAGKRSHGGSCSPWRCQCQPRPPTPPNFNVEKIAVWDLRTYFRENAPGRKSTKNTSTLKLGGAGARGEKHSYLLLRFCV